MPSLELLYRALASFRVSHRHGSQRPGSQSSVKSALKWTPWPEFFAKPCILIGAIDISWTRRGYMTSPEAAVLAKSFHLHSAAVICPGCPGYALDPGHMSRICPGSRAYPGHLRGKSHFEPPRQEKGFQLCFLLIRTAALTIVRQTPSRFSA